MKCVEMKDNCLLIDGRPVVLLSSSLFYFRIPCAYWEKRMRSLKDGGYQAIDVYIPWNFHETEPGIWDFSGMRDLDRFLELADKNGLYVVARPGPYICSEWDGGALPAWLGTQDMQLRQFDGSYLKAVETWFDKVMPILEKRQYGREGSVILLQLENELDIFQCREPKLYLEALREMTEKYSFHIPKVVCTSSQLDVDYSGGTAEGVHPAFNIYSAPDHPALEEKMEIIWGKLRETKDAFLTTETMREHSFLRRELAGGVRLISPYCQTASANYDCYTGISTWGNSKNSPVSYMTNDYDHGAMIRADGLVTEEYPEARLLGNLIAALKEELAAGTPDFHCGMKVTEDYEGRTQRKAAIRLKSGGRLYCLSNLSEKPGKAAVCFAGKEVEVPMRAHTTVLLPFGIPLKKWGLEEVKILWSSLEILSIERPDSQSWRLILYGQGSGACLQMGEEIRHIHPGENRKLQLSGGRLLDVQAVTREEAARMETAYLPAYTAHMAKKATVTAPAEILEEDICCPTAEETGTVTFMENYGIYRGAMQYLLEFPKQAKGLLLDGAADIVRVCVDGKALPAYYGKGDMIRIPSAGKTAEVRTECWGHNCGHGIGYSVIQLGSLKGVGQAFGILEEREISYNWRYYVVSDSRADTLRLPAREWPAVVDFGGRLPLDLEEMQVYQKEIAMPETGTHRFLSLIGGEIPVQVFINGKREGKLTKEKRWLDISKAAGAGQKINLALCYAAPGMNPDPGEIHLLAAQKIESCRIRRYPVSDWKKIQVLSPKTCCLPIALPVGAMKKLAFSLTEEESGKEPWIRFDGQGVKVTVIGGGHVLGRIFVNCKMPGITVCSGAADRIWLPAALFAKNRRVMLVAEAMEENAYLQKIELETYAE